MQSQRNWSVTIRRILGLSDINKPPATVKSILSCFGRKVKACTDVSQVYFVKVNSKVNATV